MTDLGVHSDQLEGPTTGDAGFIMPGERSSVWGDRRGSVSFSNTSGGSGKASRPADFWLLRGAAQLGEDITSHRSRSAGRQAPDSVGGALPSALRQRLAQAGVSVWQAAQPLSQLREYAVPVFHLEALAVERIYRQTDRRDGAAGRLSGAADAETRSPIMDSAYAVAREARRAAAIWREGQMPDDAAAIWREGQMPDDAAA
ncbi:hypothetical protein PA598K_03070, partial [Paenibacillus sp. 598K]